VDPNGVGPSYLALRPISTFVPPDLLCVVQKFAKLNYSWLPACQGQLEVRGRARREASRSGGARTLLTTINLLAGG